MSDQNQGVNQNPANNQPVRNDQSVPQNQGSVDAVLQTSSPVSQPQQAQNIEQNSGVPPIVKVQVSGCEVRVVKEKDVAGVFEDAGELLVRYGRLERKQVMDEYRQALNERSMKLESVPVAVVTANSVACDQKFADFISNEVTGRVMVDIDGAKMELKPAVVHYGGLDASKPISETDPRQYLVLPFQVRYGDPGRGIVIPAQAFEEWTKKIPRG